MTLNSSQVDVAITGEVSVAPVGTAAPTTSTSALNAAFIGLGYINEDGVVITPNDTTENIIAWQNAAVVRTVYTESFWTFQFRMIENKGETAELYFKGDVEVVSAGQWKMTVGAAGPDPRAFVLDVVDGTKHYRYYLANAEVTERGEITNSNGEAIGYDVTITAYADSNGVAFTVFTDNAAWGYS
jgi:hypothetical protein